VKGQRTSLSARRENGADQAFHSAITLEGVSHSFTTADGRRVAALRDVNFSIGASTFVAIVGPSGCGKSTVLNLISGLLKPTEGSAYVNGEQVTGIRVGVGYMPSSDSLLPWRTVQANVELPLELAGVPKRERARRAAEMLSAVGLSGSEQAFPHSLSQGMRQRVAIARTFTAGSQVILMDEPFSSLDMQTRLRVQDVFLSIWERERPTVVLITHDVSEAVALADRVIIFSGSPGTVLKESAIALPRPRQVEELMFSSAEFQGHMRSIWSSLRVE
jgi:NitT/TauT family transport system ATP-binding protein